MTALVMELWKGQTEEPLCASSAVRGGVEQQFGGSNSCSAPLLEYLLETVAAPPAVSAQDFSDSSQSS